MIILPSRTGLLLFRQPDHAALSARIAAAWRRPQAIPSSMWPRFLEAVRLHDEGWRAEEKGPTLDPEGCPYDFKTLPPGIHIEVWRRGADPVRPVDPYIALLVAQHNRWLYEMLKAEFTSLRGDLLEFPAEMEARIERERAVLLEGSGDERAAVTPAALEVARRLLSLFDGLSLMLLDAIPVPARTPALAFGDREAELGIERTAEGLSIGPWPFDPPTLSLSIEGARLERCRFSSPEELAQAMGRASAEVAQRQLVPSPQP